MKNGIIPVKGENRPGLGEAILHFNANSGAQAINLAYLKDATRIILLGYDMQKTNGKNHWFGDHPKGMHNGNYSGFVSHFDRLAEDLKSAGVEVINCTRETALYQFKRAALSEAL